jgi:Isopropylmalate/homocitrate/citramalate synthases
LKIIDKTLTFLSQYSVNTEDLMRTVRLLSEIKVDSIELPVSIYEQLGRSLPSDGRYLLRVNNYDQAAHYPEFGRFVCRGADELCPQNMVRELQLNDIREVSLSAQLSPGHQLRVTGLDDILNYNYERTFTTIINRAGESVELCPENRYFCATAIACEWLLGGGETVVTAFGGLNGSAATEEVLMSMRIERRRHPNLTYSAFPELKSIIERLTGERFSERKSVIGDKIFYVESGIHVDGILKKPQMYEPFPPEVVGGTRRFVIGKYSGRKAISVKLAEAGLPADEYDVAALLGAVRRESVQARRGLSDAEFMMLSEDYKLKRSVAGI